MENRLSIVHFSLNRGLEKYIQVEGVCVCICKWIDECETINSEKSNRNDKNGYEF